MILGLHNLQPARGSKKKTKRVGRGNASGHGTYSTRGSKGQRARSGGRNRLKQKGWRHILLSTPKSRGFKSLKTKSVIVNLEKIEKFFSEGEKVNPQTLREKRIISSVGFSIKILGQGELSKKIEVEGCSVSAAAREKIEKAGGKIR
ncbi:MAG: 50S ribosomal protein L15 [Candidatus Magasanikbacteria bacterium]|nr:50S ribosomal protein L15 [Candidatus Magasanikbacteria bacterium]